MLSKVLVAGCVLGLATGVSPSYAGVTTTHGTAIQQPNNEWRVDISGSNQSVTVAGNANDVIEYIRVTCTTTGQHVTVTVGGSLSNVREISRTSASSGGAELWLASVEAGEIGNLAANVVTAATATSGDVYGNMSLGPTTQGSTHVLGLLESDLANITGDISVAGTIGQLLANQGVIASVAPKVLAINSGAIGGISANSVTANITITGDDADLNSLVADVGGFTGVLLCDRIIGSGLDFGLNIAGDLDAIIDHADVMATNFRIGGSFAEDAEINLPEDGLTKQIIFNAIGQSNSWAGVLSVDGSPLNSQPYYTDTAVNTGGGAAGLASFHLHESSCAPPNDATYAVRRNSVSEGCVQNPDPVMRFYGAVIIASTGYYAYVEEYVGGGTWVRVDWDHEPVFVAGGDTAERTVRVKRDSSGSVWPTGYYRISARPGKLLCKNVGQSGSEPQVASFYYYLLMVDDCEEELLAVFDLNEDGAVTVGGDLSAWAASPSDVNSDGSVNAGDAQSVITAADTWAALQPN